MLNFIQLIHYLIKKVYFYNICIKQETFGLNFVLFYQVRKRNWLYRCNTVVSLTQFIYQTFIEYLLHARHTSRQWGQSRKQNNKNSLFSWNIYSSEKRQHVLGLKTIRLSEITKILNSENWFRDQGLPILSKWRADKNEQKAMKRIFHGGVITVTTAADRWRKTRTEK